MLRDRHDREHVAMILIGMPGIGQQFRHFPRLSSRLGRSLGRSLDPDDFTDAQAIAAIERITRGNFRLLERLFPQIARVLNITRLEATTAGVIETAASILVIGS